MKHKTIRSRQELIHQVRDRLMRESAPRLQLALIISLAGLGAFLTSFLALRLGLPWMAVRYPLAVAGGYAIFFVLIRWWIVWQRRFDEATLANVVDAGDMFNVSDLAGLRPPGSAAREIPMFAAGRGGGAGASTQWAAGSSSAGPPSSGKGSGLGFDLDLDEMWWIVIAAVCVLGGAIAIGYVVYAAPLLLSEVALDAAIVSTLYSRLRRDDVSHWARTVLRKTWIPALLITIFAGIGGYAMQQIAPEAQSIGGVVRALRQ